VVEAAISQYEANVDANGSDAAADFRTMSSKDVS
jgi:hypothetical protein